MANTAINPMLRTLTVSLVGLAGILAFAIYVAVNSPARYRAEAALAEVLSKAEEARKDAADRIETLEQENSDLKKRLEAALANLDRRDAKLAAAEQDVVRLRGELDVTLKQVAELSQKYAAARIKKAEDTPTEAHDAQRKTNLDADAVKKDTPVTVVKAPSNKIEVVHVGKGHGHPNGKNNNVAANKRRGANASLPRTSPSFSELDTDHDGRLSMKEYKTGFPGVADVEQEFKSLDSNGDGTLSLDEYKAGHPDPPLVRIKKAKKN
ncbi:MAG: EF-hand domain-containing protein [Planctomycetota bacterium]